MPQVLSLRVSAVATAVVNAVRSAASQRAPQSCSHNTSSLRILITSDTTTSTLQRPIRFTTSAEQQRALVMGSRKTLLWTNKEEILPLCLDCCLVTCTCLTCRFYFWSFLSKYYQGGIFNQCQHQYNQQPVCLCFLHTVD